MTPEDVAGLMARAYTHQMPWRASDVADILNQPITRLVTAPGGVLVARIVADEAEILALAVDPDHQRSGTGRRLVAEFHALCIAAGVTRAVLDVAEDNGPARALYRACGYHETARRAGYYKRADGSRADALLMARAMTEGHAGVHAPRATSPGKTG